MITVEDVNSCLNRYGVHGSYHEIDTNEIGQNAYADVKYDFVICGHTISGDNHTFTFKVSNSAWTGGYYFLDAEGCYINSNASYNSSTEVLSLTTSNSSVVLVLYLHNLASSFSFVRLTNKLFDDSALLVDYGDVGDSKSITYVDLTTGETSTTTITLSEGLNTVLTNHLLMVYVRKIDYEFELRSNLIIGKINKVSFNESSDFDADCIATYNDKNVEFKLSDGEFDLDLSDYDSLKSIDVNVQILENEDVLGASFKFKLAVNYLSVGNYADLVNQINAGVNILQLTQDITCYSNIYINHDVLIKGVEHSLDLTEYSFFVANGCNLKLEKLDVNNGNPVIVQRNNSKVDLISCSFTGASNTRNNNLGSVISCDVDIDSLSLADDFITNIDDCTFIDNHNCILHGGTLNITDSKYHNMDMDYIDINNPGFLYQVDGTALITNSIFDIDYTSEDYAEENLMYAQALFMCGEDAIINNASHNALSNDNNVNWCNSPYNNLSHVFCKYYYPQIEQVVFTSPEEGYEDKSLCYCVSGLDWIFKEHVQVTQDFTNAQNNTRKITWEE